METTMNFAQTTERIEVMKYKIVSLVPQIMERRGWEAIDLIRRGLAYNTSFRLQRGETNLSLTTIVQACEAFEVDNIDSLFKLVRNE